MSVDNANSYFKQIYNSILEDDDIFNIADTYIKKTKRNVKNWIKKIRGVSLEGLEVDNNDQIDYFYEIIELLQSLPKSSPKIIFLIDEFPDCVSNIAMNNKKEAINFLQQNRDLRQQYSDLNIQFVLTGSIGLGNVVKRLGREDIITDLEFVEVPPLSNDEATELIDRLCLGLKNANINIHLDDSTKAYLLEKIVWNIPYYIQIIVDELGDEIVENEYDIKSDDIDRIIDKIIKDRSHADYFSNWKVRLRNTFEKLEEQVAIKILNYISRDSTMCFDDIKRMIQDKVNLKELLEILKYDGYINEFDGVYRFNSPILKAWWAYRVAE